MRWLGGKGLWLVVLAVGCAGSSGSGANASGARSGDSVGASSGAASGNASSGNASAGAPEAQSGAGASGASPSSGSPSSGALSAGSGATPSSGSAAPIHCTAGGSSGAPSAGAGTLFTVDLARGPARQFEAPAKPVSVSPYVYGINAFGIWETTTQWGLARLGGDATTVWNWTNNYSNSGADYCFWQGQDGGGSALAGSITSDPSAFTIPKAQALGIAYLATIPIVDHVSATFSNNTGINNLCPGNATCSGGGGNGYAMNTGNLDFVSTDPSSTAFVANAAAKPGGSYCTCQPGGTCASGCAVKASGPVYQDEFVNYLKVNYGHGGAPVFIMLDNEPNYWPGTHPEIWPHSGTLGCGTSGTVGFDEIVDRNTTYATAVKNAWPETRVFGPVVAQDGIIYAGSYGDAHLPTPFMDYYLSEMATRSVSAGKPLLDAFDVHYYTSNDSASQCLQVPRMFWDPSFQDFTAAATDSIDYGWSGQNNYFDKSLFPRQMIPRLLGRIANAYMGQNTPAPGLSFSEYNPGCELQIEGGVAEADLLGIFGREGVFAATAWPLKNVTANGKLVNYLVAAYDLYRNYDGKGAVVGDTSVYATTSDVEDTSVYAFVHSNDSSTVELIALNKSAAARQVTVDLADGPALSHAAAYQLVGASPAVTTSTAAPTVACSACDCTFTITLPATSAMTVVLR